MLCAARSMTWASAWTASSSGPAAGSGSGGEVVSGAFLIRSSGVIRSSIKRSLGTELVVASAVVVRLVVVLVMAVDDEERPVPSCVCEEVEGHVAELAQPLLEVGVGGRLRTVERPVHEEGPALDHGTRHRSPVPGVAGEVAVVPHREVLPLGDTVGRNLVTRLPWLAQQRPVRDDPRILVDDVRLGQRVGGGGGAPGGGGG